MSIKIKSLIVFITTIFCAYSEEIDLSKYEKSLYSQHGEDGVLNKMMELIPPFLPIFLDLGANGKSVGSNSQLLRLQGAEGITINRLNDDEQNNFFREYITADTINKILIKRNVPHEFYFLFIDMGYNDFYLWQKLDKKYEPTIVMIRYNPTHLPKEDKIVKYHPFYCGDGTAYFGASILALYNLGKSKGYSLVYADRSGSNLVFVKDAVLEKQNLSFKNMNDVEKIYRCPINTTGPNGRFRNDSMDRPYLSSVALIK